MPILETPKDKSLERRAVGRFTALTHTEAIELPALSAVDYFIMDFGQLKAGLEIKTRKETPAQVRSYGGLILKHRKYQELKQIGEMLNISTYVLFAFGNAEAELCTVAIDEIRDPRPQEPPVRKNYRGLACDEEPVLFLDWEIVRPLDGPPW